MTDKTNIRRLNLLILYQKQFGYHIDTYFYSKYLRHRHNITYLCWDYLKPKQKMDDVRIIYVSRSGNIFTRNWKYFSAVISYLRHNKIDICFIVYFRGCSLLRLLFPKQKFIFDIRSGYIKKNALAGIMYNFFLKIESSLFRNVTIISKSLAKKLRLKKYSLILPLGSISISKKNKIFNDLKLIYVGTLLNRKIERTILGTALFLRKNPTKKKSFIYTIIGDSDQDEAKLCRTLIEKLNLENYIKLPGRIPFDHLKPYFDTHNTGVSFIPMTPYFDCQPPTKTFDYLLSGMPVIATATAENKLIINKDNGILIDDTIEGFSNGLEEICHKQTQFNSQVIMNTSQIYDWRFIINDLEKFLLSICNSS